MERKFLESIRLDPQVVDYILDQIARKRTQVEKTRSGEFPLKNGFIRSVIQKVIRSKKIIGSSEQTISIDRISGLITVIANSSIMFSTRDWGVAGTISAMSGSLAVGMWKK